MSIEATDTNVLQNLSLFIDRIDCAHLQLTVKNIEIVAQNWKCKYLTCR